MTQDELFFGALKDLVGGRVYPGIAKEGTAVPYITYQDIGGDAVNFVDRTLPSKANARVQVNVYSKTRAEAKAIARQAENALRGVLELQTIVIGAPMTTHEPSTGYHGTIQDFSVWTDV
ncbi:DUF3168 domain-containing protein [[Empedobacter] haloabium]|uniref:DUF3168 domain-containing protein n=1 Tax=[Empedobacter] haloabium TaxID=592317 RepID=A0ABZ1USM0_9BURK